MSNIIIKGSKDTMLMTAVNDFNLSRTAKGMLMDLLYMDKEATVKSLTSMSSEGQTKVTTALKELESKGYLTRERTRDNGKLDSFRYILTTPIYNSQFEVNCWLHNKNGDYVCSLCGAKFSKDLLCINLSGCGLCLPNYCPMCGQKIKYLQLV